MTQIGAVSGLWRYPVKSMGGQPLREVAAGTRGLAGDRAWAIVDGETGRIASAKRPKLWRVLLECRARYDLEPDPDGPPVPVTITLPSGAEVSSEDPDRDARLSEAFGRPVSLASRVPENAGYEVLPADEDGRVAEGDETLGESEVGLFAPGTFFDSCSLHVVAEQSLARMGAAHPGGRWDPRRFRPNVLLDLGAASPDDFAENAWSGHTLRLGESVEAAVIAPMPRCVMTTVPQGDLPRDPLVLRTIARSNRVAVRDYGSFACLGAMANVTAAGTLRVGDPAALA